MSVISAKLNANHTRDVRLALEPLAAIAEETGAAMLAIAHFNKSSARTPPA